MAVRHYPALMGISAVSSLIGLSLIISVSLGKMVMYPQWMVLLGILLLTLGISALIGAIVHYQREKYLLFAHPSSRSMLSLRTSKPLKKTVKKKKHRKHRRRTHKRR